MKSIRSRLTFWILGSLVVLLIAAGSGVYLSTQKSLLTILDAELTLSSRVVRFSGRTDEGEPAGPPRSGAARRMGNSIPIYHDAASSDFFQKWNSDGETIEKSQSLGELSLPYPIDQISIVPEFSTESLPDGREVRTMKFRNAQTGKGKGKGKGKGPRDSTSSVTMLAKELTAVNESLTSLLAGLIVAGLISIFLAAVIVHIALKHGLQPIELLAKQSTHIDADSLDARFDDSNAPIELKPIYRHLNDLLQRLEKSFDRERRFSADLAHEIRTPIAELKVLNEVALKWPEQSGPETYSESVVIADQVNAMIENLLNLARWESGEVPLKELPVDIEAVARDCWDSFSSSADSKQIVVDFDFESNSETWVTDENMFRHIVSNLLSNAVEYTPLNGTIKVTAHEHTLEISNTTSDFSDDDADWIFDRFWRGDQSRTDSDHSGLGLSLSKACAHALNLKLIATHSENRMTIRIENDHTHPEKLPD